MLPNVRSWYSQGGWLQQAVTRTGAEPLFFRLAARYDSFREPVGTLTESGISARFRTGRGWGALRDSDEAELMMLRDFINEMNNGDIVFDIGGQYGLYTAFALRAVRDSSVVVAEPSYRYYPWLAANASLNADSDRYYLLKTAITNSEGVESDWMQRQLENATVTTGDDIVSRMGKSPSILKIDIEGGELQALQGLEKTLSNESLRLVYCEVHPTGTLPQGIEGLSAGEVDTLTELLQTNGFVLSKIANRDDQPFIKAERQ